VGIRVRRERPGEGCGSTSGLPGAREKRGDRSRRDPPTTSSRKALSSSSPGRRASPPTPTPALHHRPPIPLRPPLSLTVPQSYPYFSRVRYAGRCCRKAYQYGRGSRPAAGRIPEGSDRRSAPAKRVRAATAAFMTARLAALPTVNAAQMLRVRRLAECAASRLIHFAPDSARLDRARAGLNLKEHLATLAIQPAVREDRQAEDRVRPGERGRRLNVRCSPRAGTCTSSEVDGVAL
jgi:hypothetical protein